MTKSIFCKYKIIKIPLEIAEGRLFLNVLVECKLLDIKKQRARFIVDTGSKNSYISKSVLKNFPIKTLRPKSIIGMGGNAYKKIELPRITFHLMKDQQKVIGLKVRFKTLQKTNNNNAMIIPSIIGIDFLREQLMSLHVVLTEEMAYLQFEG